MLNNMYTTQGEALTDTPWEIYPRPQLRRESYMNLNGIWELSVEGQAEPFSIQVPFCPESKLSGVEYKDFIPAIWYRRFVNLIEDQLGGHVFLHFGAVDYKTIVFINGKEAGCHEGGYSSFSFDINEEENRM